MGRLNFEGIEIATVDLGSCLQVKIKVEDLKNEIWRIHRQQPVLVKGKDKAGGIREPWLTDDGY